MGANPGEFEHTVRLSEIEKHYHGLSGVINDLTTTGTDGTAVLLVVGALYRMNRGAVVKALGEKRTAQLDGWAEELAKELRKRIPVIVDVIGRDFPDVGG